MENVFGWLGQIFDAILSLFPRRIIVPPTSKLIKYTYNGKAIECEAGLSWYFPLLTMVEEVAVARQSLNDILPIKFLSYENIPMIADAAIIFEVDDVISFKVKNWDTIDTIRESISASICKNLTNKPLAELKDLETLNDELTSAVEDDLDGFGVLLEDVRINNITFGLTIASV